MARSFLVNVLSGEFQLVVIGELGYFLDHFLELFFGGATDQTRCFYFEIAVFDDELAEVEVGALLEKAFEIERGRVIANLGAEDDLVAARYAALLGQGKYGLETVAVDRNNDHGFGVIIVGELPADRVGVLFKGRKKIHGQ